MNNEQELMEYRRAMYRLLSNLYINEVDEEMLQILIGAEFPEIEDEIGWVLLDKTGLWYKSNLVEILDEKDINVKDIPTGRDFDVEEYKEKAAKLENMEMDSSVAEGGG